MYYQYDVLEYDGKCRCVRDKLTKRQRQLTNLNCIRHSICEIKQRSILHIVI